MHFLNPAHENYIQQNKVGETSYRKKLLILIGVFSAIRLFLAFICELGNDEAYYWLYSQYWQWNYFDHPPMVAVWIRVFTANLALEQYEVFIRLGSVVGCALSSWFLFKAVTLLHSEKAGWFAAVLYNISFYSSITAGLYILPDSPQMVFWTLALLLIARITKNENSWTNWLLFGVVTGLCIMSKIHGVFLWIGLGGFILFQQIKWLKKPQLYVAFLITLIIISPIFFWNLAYNFATFRFHSNRVDVEEFVLHGKYFLTEIRNQFFFNNPVVSVLGVTGIIAWFRKKMDYQPAMAIYIFVGAPLAFLLLFVSLFRNVTLPHWSGPAYISFIPIAAIWLSNSTDKFFPLILKFGMVIFFVSYLGYTLVVKFYPGTFGSHNKEEQGRGDLTLDMYGWRQGAIKFDSLYRNDVRKNIMPANAALVSSNWWGAHVEYYFARPLHLKMIGLGGPRQINEYLWTNKWRKNEVDLNNAYCIIPTDDKYYVPAVYYQTKELVFIIDVNRSGKLSHSFAVYRLRGLKRPVPVVN